MSPTISPSGTASDASCTARRPRNDLLTPVSSRRAIGTPFSPESELDERDERYDGQKRIERDQVDADIAFAAAQHPRSHERFIDGVERPKDGGDQREGILPSEIDEAKKSGRNERGERVADEEREGAEYEAHELVRRPSLRASAG